MNGDDMTHPVTRGELKAELDEFRRELRGEMAELRGDMTRDMAQLRGELRGEMAELRGDMTREMAQLRGDMKQHANAIIEALRVEMRTIFEPVQDLPGRVTKLEDLPARVTRLENAVFTPKPKRRRRRAA